MNNTDRINALALARDKAYTYALLADAQGDTTVADLDFESERALRLNIKLARMWARIAEAMKVGNAQGADGAMPSPVPRPAFGPGHLPLPLKLEERGE